MTLDLDRMLREDAEQRARRDDQELRRRGILAGELNPDESPHGAPAE